jgi:hypothetical protein
MLKCLVGLHKRKLHTFSTLYLRLQNEDPEDLGAPPVADGGRGVDTADPGVDPGVDAAVPGGDHTDLVQDLPGDQADVLDPEADQFQDRDRIDVDTEAGQGPHRTLSETYSRFRRKRRSSPIG